MESLLNESGGHRHQRVPPTERNGRVHTSTVTVVATEISAQNKQFSLKDSDLKIQTTRSSGCGGQHRNKTESAVIAVHVPTNTRVRIEQERSQHQNRRIAKDVLEHRISSGMARDAERLLSEQRRVLAGSGERGDKIRTYRWQDNTVTDHRTGKKQRLSDVMKGRIFE